MILLLSPAKTLDYSDPTNEVHSQPRLLAKSGKLIHVLNKQSIPQLRRLMNISEDLALLNAERFADFRTPFTPDNAKQAILAFKGDVYLGLKAEDFNTEDLRYAQEHVRILSGLYGVLRPMDLIQPYRLEMGTKLKNGHGKNLYEFWGDQITRILKNDLEEHPTRAVINLASKEYFKSVKTEQLQAPWYQIDFKEERNGAYRIIAFFAKKARGRMTRYAVKNRLMNPDQLKNFKEDGYSFNEDLSGEKHFVFTR